MGSKAGSSNWRQPLVARPLHTLTRRSLRTLPPSLADVNACLVYTCNNGEGKATCTDLPAPAPNSPSGRNCSCAPGQYYSSDAVGCVIADCIGAWSPWGPCSVACGGGTQGATYNVTRPAQSGGAACPYATGNTRSQACNPGSCRVQLMDVGFWHSAAVRTNGSLAVWGSGRRNQTAVPADLDGVSIAAVSAGGFHTYVGGADACCGGLLPHSVRARLTRLDQHIRTRPCRCVLTSAKSVVCWGLNADGQTDVPAGLSGKVAAISAGGFHT